VKFLKTLIINQLRQGGGKSLIDNKLQPDFIEISPDLATEIFYENPKYIQPKDSISLNKNLNNSENLNNLNSKIKGNPTSNNSWFRVIIFNPDGKYKTHADCVIGNPYNPRLGLDSGVPYTIIAFSFDSSDYLPPMNCYEIDCKFEYNYSNGPAYAYQRIDNYVFQKETFNVLDIKLKHKIPQVKIRVKTDKLSDKDDNEGAIVDNSIISNIHFSKATIQLKNGNIINLENPVALKIPLDKTSKDIYDSEWTSILINKDKNAKYFSNITANINGNKESKIIQTPLNIKSNSLNKITISVIPNKNGNSNPGKGGNGDNNGAPGEGNNNGDGNNGNNSNENSSGGNGNGGSSEGGKRLR